MENITLGQISALVLFLGSFIGGLIVLYNYIKKWLKSTIKSELDDIYIRIEVLELDSKRNKEENLILLKGQLACLKGLKEQGCNGPVTQSISEIENYLLEQVRR